MRFVDEEGNDRRACRLCFNTERLCIRIIKHENAYHFGIYPLASADLIDKSWDDLGFWLKAPGVKEKRCRKKAIHGPMCVFGCNVLLQTISIFDFFFDFVMSSIQAAFDFEVDRRLRM